MSKVKTIQSYKTEDGELFTNLEEANYHADKLNAEYLLNNDNDFRDGLNQAINYIAFQTYSEIKFNHATDIVPVNLHLIEKMIGHEIVDYTKLNAFGGLINDQLEDLNLQLATKKGPQDETATRGVYITYRDASSFTTINLENRIGHFMFPYYDAFDA